jgi:hypothetical protein
MGEAKRREELRDGVRNEMRNGGDEAFFDYLMTYKIPDDFDPNKPPPGYIEHMQNLPDEDKEIMIEMFERLNAIANRRGGKH